MADGIELAWVFLGVASPVLVALFLKHYFRYKSETAQKLAELDLRSAANETAGLRTLVRELKSRVEVLEAIVTDEGYELRKQIASL